MDMVFVRDRGFLGHSFLKRKTEFLPVSFGKEEI
jgi:hypothetical protein